MYRVLPLAAVSFVAFAASPASPALADPCGMVPPIYIGDGLPIVRVGLQKTYVFYKDGVETFVIRPGFEGKVEDFGMLIPFPKPPALRKVSEDVFAQIDAAIDPPEVVVYLYDDRLKDAKGQGKSGGKPGQNAEKSLELHTVRVLKEEAVGMYEVAVLEAGSAAALKQWMDDHGYKYPVGMDDVCNEYIKLGWCFVAERARVGGKANVDPQPDMREVDTRMPPGSTFDGHVQAMGFRFETDEIVVPMRLSAFNEGERRNVVYLLTDGPKKIRSIPEEYVVRQVSGQDLFAHVTEPLPLRIIGGGEADIPELRLKTLPQERDPEPHNGVAKELFAGDLLAARSGRLSHPFEENEKQLLRIGEHFSIRGPEIDKLNLEALKDDRAKVVAEALEDIKDFTLTLVDGDFPREVMAGGDMIFSEYRMPRRRNTSESYDAKSHGPSEQQQGYRKLGRLSREGETTDAVGSTQPFAWPRAFAAIGFALALTLTGMLILRRRGQEEKPANHANERE